MQELQKSRKGYKVTEIGEIPIDWKDITLADISEEIYRYPTYYNINYVNDGVPEVRGELLKEDGILEKDRSKYRFISGQTSNRFARTILKKDDFVLSVRGTIGKVAIVHKEMEGANITANLIRISPKRSLIYPLFLKYCLISEPFQTVLNNLSPQTTIKTIQAPLLKSIKLPVPFLEEQKKIASILSKVDELNQKTGRIILQTQRLKKGLMQKLFRYGVESSGRLRDPVKNPEIFKDTKAGLVPEDWTVCPVGKMITLQRGFDITNRELVRGDVPVISSSGITARHNASMVNGPGVITGRKGTLGKVYYIESPYWPHDTTLWVRDFHGNYPIFVFRFLENMHLERFNASTANPTLNRNSVHPITAAFPLVHEQKRISEIIEAISRQIEMSTSYRESMASLKKGLLQKLLTGKMRVKV